MRTQSEPTTISEKTLHDMYTMMIRIRKFEEKVAENIINKEITTPCHLYVGQEAIATGVCTALRRTDFVFSTHRSHGHYIAKGGDIKTLMAELYCKATGCSKGNGGSMHIAEPKSGLPGSSAIVAGTIPLSVGAAYSFFLQKKDNVSVAFFGDGAVGEGTFYESLNLASLKKLPVIFVCENNLFSTHMPITACLAGTDIYKKVETFDIPTHKIDGNDVCAVYRAALQVIEDARTGKGPAFLECTTYRWFGHVGPNYDVDKGLRSKEDLEYWMKKCPIKRLERYLIRNNLLSESKKRAIHNKIENEIEEAIAFKNNSSAPSKEQLTRSVFKE
jgi:TPP-dependent pyruvate/acetoin dehydrogenase alpha subunit